MKNRMLAVCIIGTYPLAMLASASVGMVNPVASLILTTVAGVATVVFTIMAIIRLWKIQKSLSLLFALSSGISVILPLLHPWDESLLGLLIRLVNFSIFVGAIVVLWKAVLIKKSDVAPEQEQESANEF